VKAWTKRKKRFVIYCPAILEILEIIVGKGRTVERILKVTKNSPSGRLLLLSFFLG
jgi:hypothetical protein